MKTFGEKLFLLALVCAIVLAIVAMGEGKANGQPRWEYKSWNIEHGQPPIGWEPFGVVAITAPYMYGSRTKEIYVYLRRRIQ